MSAHHPTVKRLIPLPPAAEFGLPLRGCLQSPVLRLANAQRSFPVCVASQCCVIFTLSASDTQNDSLPRALVHEAGAAAIRCHCDQSGLLVKRCLSSCAAYNKFFKNAALAIEQQVCGSHGYCCHEQTSHGSVPRDTCLFCSAPRSVHSPALEPFTIVRYKKIR